MSLQKLQSPHSGLTQASHRLHLEGITTGQETMTTEDNDEAHLHKYIHGFQEQPKTSWWMVVWISCRNTKVIQNHNDRTLSAELVLPMCIYAARRKTHEQTRPRESLPDPAPPQHRHGRCWFRRSWVDGCRRYFRTRSCWRRWRGGSRRRRRGWLIPWRLLEGSRKVMNG